MNEKATTRTAHVLCFSFSPILVFRGRDQAPICASEKINLLFCDIHALATGVGQAQRNCPCLCRLSLEIRLTPTSFDCAVAAGLSRQQHDIPIVSEIAGLAATQCEWSM
jgi:hypothetical protein